MPRPECNNDELIQAVDVASQFADFICYNACQQDPVPDWIKEQFYEDVSNTFDKWNISSFGNFALLAKTLGDYDRFKDVVKAYGRYHGITSETSKDEMSHILLRSVNVNLDLDEH